LVDVEGYGFMAFGEFYGQGEADIAEADDGDCGFSWWFEWGHFLFADDERDFCL
jgi:hypothetical protein